MYMDTIYLAMKDALRNPLLTACVCIDAMLVWLLVSHPREEVQRQLRPSDLNAAGDESEPGDEVSARYFTEHPPCGVEEAKPRVRDDVVVGE
jgi:hypothetical protein